LVNSKSVPAWSVAACVLAALAAVTAFGIGGNLRAGLALGTGLVIGSMTGFAAMRALDSPVGFRLTSMLRIGVMTVAGFGVGAVIGLQYVWLVLIGVASAQLMLVALAATSVVRR
jgi:hypothetical protein